MVTGSKKKNYPVINLARLGIYYQKNVIMSYTLFFLWKGNLGATVNFKSAKGCAGHICCILKLANYLLPHRDSSTFNRDSVSSIYSCLHQKWNNIMIALRWIFVTSR